jgi:hypothetical protein
LTPESSQNPDGALIRREIEFFETGDSGGFARRFMIISIEIDGAVRRFDLADPHSLAIPLRFNGPQPNAYGVAKAGSTPCEAGTLVGDTRLGGSCNFEQYTFIPHCNGTHTECVGHLTDERISVDDCLRDALIPSLLISVKPESAASTSETYAVEINEKDLLITRSSIEKALLAADRNLTDGLVVRTLPNDVTKLSRAYLNEIPPFFSTEAMGLLGELKVRHLLVDLPSIDRIYDEGKLSNHRIFWNVKPGSRQISTESFSDRTITELIYVSEDLADGRCLLNLQIAPFSADAAPSRPLLFRELT